MAADFQWAGWYGESGSPTTADLGVSGNLFNYKTLNSLASPADYTSFPITAGANSYEVWLRGHFTGTFNQIQNLKFWKSAGSLGTGEALKFVGNVTAFDDPTTADSSYATSDVPTSSPGSANVSLGGSLAGTLESAGFSDFMISQLQTTTAAEAGDTETFTFTLTYDEN
jgi:hypothetical protein